MGAGVAAPVRIAIDAWPTPFRAAYLKITALQSLAIVVITALAVWIGDEATDSVIALVSVFAGSLVLGQWFVNALSHSYSEALIDALQGRDPETMPRVRLHWDWMRRDVGNRIAAVLALVCGQVLLAPLLLIDEKVNAAALAVWGAYCVVLFVAAPGAEESERSPALDRGLHALGQAPVVGVYARVELRLLRRFMRGLQPARARVDREPARFAGLALVRVVSSLPIVSLWTRPFIIVSALR